MKGQPLRLGFQLTLLLLLLIFGWWLLRTNQFQEIGRILQQLTLAKGVNLVAANLLVLITLAGRWWLFLYGLGHRLPFLALLRYRIAAFAISYFTPGPHFGGEPLQVYLVNQRHDVPAATAIASVTLDKVLEMTTNFAVLIGGALLILQQEVFTITLVDQPRAALVSVLFLLSAIGLVVWVGRQRIAHWVNHKAQAGRLAHWLETFRQSVGQMVDLWRSKPALFLAAGAVSLLSWMALISEFWYMTAALELELGFTQAMTLLFAMRLAILLPMPAGLGALEAGLALATTALGLSPAAGLSMGLLIRLRDVLLGLLGLWLGGFALCPQRLASAGFHTDKSERG
jgi:uncharacterized protein (TIRG00374 family)